MKSKLLKSTALCLVLLATSATQILAQSNSIFGVYKQCPFGCRFIKINHDFTFEELLNGDLYNNKRSKGIWKFIGENKIKAEGAKPTGEPLVRETSENRNNFIVTVVDSSGVIVQSAEISGESNGKNFSCIITENESCEIPKTERFDVTFANYRGTHKIKNVSANVFLVELTVDKLEPIIDEVWLIENNRLFVADSDGTFNKEYGFEKVSRKMAKKLFP